MEHAGKRIIAADMGGLKSYRVDYISETGRYHIEALEDIDYIEGRKKTGDLLSDDRGNFQHASGENHTLEHHVEQELVRTVAGDISKLLADAEAGSCYLAFPARHHDELVAALSETARKAVFKSVSADLRKCPAGELLKHFS